MCCSASCIIAQGRSPDWWRVPDEDAAEREGACAHAVYLALVSGRWKADVSCDQNPRLVAYCLQLILARVVAKAFHPTISSCIALWL